MKTHMEQSDEVFGAFLANEQAIEDKIPAYVQVLGADKCLQLAARAVQPEIMRQLIQFHRADSRQTQPTHSDHHPNTPLKRSLLDEVMDSALFRKDVDLDKAYEAINVLVKDWQDRKPKGTISVLMNDDPLESPIMAAHLLAFPGKSNERDMPHHDLIAGTVLEGKPEPFKKIYAFFVGRVPDDVKKVEDAIEMYGARLRTEFTAAQRLEKEEEATTSTPPRIGQIGAQMVFSALDKK